MNDGSAVSRVWLERACDLLEHRGPDRGALWRDDERVGFAHRRLRIIDLAESADQPMHNAGCVAACRATPLTIVFNGEIYNYRALHRQLLAGGHVFHTESDTEVILHLYEDHGPACVEKLRGMFALAIWDSARQQLFIARDRVGKKPLYWRRDGSRFWFASEPRAILADPEVPMRVDPAAIDAYLRLGFVPSPGSAFAGLNRLPPAHWALVRREGMTLERYWTLSHKPAPIREEEALEELDTLLGESVALRLLSDVPLGALLSGGIDSSAVVAYMARHGAVRTFSIGFDDEAYDELPFARAVAAHLGTEHHELRVRPDVAGLLPRLAWHLGEPFADSSAVPAYYVAQLARRHVTVALNGDGGDENFGGYRRYRGYAALRKYQSLPAVPRALLARAVRWLPEPRRSRSSLYDLHRLAAALEAESAAAYAGWFGFFARPESVTTAEFQAFADGADSLRPIRDALHRWSDSGPETAAMAADAAVYLPDDLLVKSDLTAMAHALEGRSPLLDHEIMEFAARLPVHLKIRRGRGKYLLRRLVAPLLPPGILERPKMGFGVPLDRWLREELATFTRDIVLSRVALERGIVDPRAVRRIVDEHMSGARVHPHRLWALLMLELWHRECVDSVTSSTGSVPVAVRST